MAVAILLILLERVGSIRAPAKSALTSFTATLLVLGNPSHQEALDQFGAFLGPLFVFLVLSLNKGSELQGYQLAFGLLGIFAIMTLVILTIAKIKYPHPDELEGQTKTKGLRGNRAFFLYMIAIVFIAMGFIDYPVLAFHIGIATPIDVIYVPLLYSLAMGVDALAALSFGHLFDKKGIIALILSVAISIGNRSHLLFVGWNTRNHTRIILWGIGMGAQESILKAVIATMVSKEKRATAYGVFYTVFGSAWALGSLLIGVLYESNILYVVLFSMIMEVVALITLLIYRNRLLLQPND